MHATLSTNFGGPIITLIRPDLTTSAFNVDVACSGIYSIIGFTIFALFIAYLTRGKLVNKLAILAMGIPLIIALNIIRITTILAIGYNFGENLALQIFHTVGATALMFIGTILLLAITEKAFKQPKPTPPCPTCNPTPKPFEPFCPNCGKLFKQVKLRLTRADIAKIFCVALVTIMLLSIQAPVFALTKAPPYVMVQTPKGIQTNTSISLLPNVNGYALNYVYRDTQFEQLSGDDQALIYAYGSPNETVQQHGSPCK